MVFLDDKQLQSYRDRKLTWQTPHHRMDGRKLAMSAARRPYAALLNGHAEAVQHQPYGRYDSEIKSPHRAFRHRHIAAVLKEPRFRSRLTNENLALETNSPTLHHSL